MENSGDVQVTNMPLGQLRALRASLQTDEDALSYVRRIAQGRIDFALAEQRQRRGVADHDSASPAGGGVRPTSTTSRPPRPIEDSSSHPLAVEFDVLCDRLGAHRLTELTTDELDSLVSALQTYELERSSERHNLFIRLDVLSAELVRRYRVGEASIDSLLAATE